MCLRMIAEGDREAGDRGQGAGAVKGKAAASLDVSRSAPVFVTRCPRNSV